MTIQTTGGPTWHAMVTVVHLLALQALAVTVEVAMPKATTTLPVKLVHSDIRLLKPAVVPGTMQVVAGYAIPKPTSALSHPMVNIGRIANLLTWHFEQIFLPKMPLLQCAKHYKIVKNIKERR